MIPDDFFRRSRMYNRYKKYAKYDEYSMHEIYDFLSSPKSVAKMIHVNDLGKSALEGVVRELESKFGEKFKFLENNDKNDKINTVKQCVGSFVREILRDYGYEPGKSCKLPKGLKYFRNASHYNNTGEGKTKEIKFESINFPDEYED